MTEKNIYRKGRDHNVAYPITRKTLYLAESAELGEHGRFACDFNLIKITGKDSHPFNDFLAIPAGSSNAGERRK